MLLFESSFYAFGFYAAVNALIMLVLSMRVVRARFNTNTAYGDAGSVTDRKDPTEILDGLLRDARRAGADAADAVFVASVAASVSYRLGRLEELERAESWDLGLRVFVDEKVAFVSSTDLARDTLAELPIRAVAMARLAPEDKFAG